MGRTAIAFLVLVAVAGCVADDQGPAAALAARDGQPFTGVAPSYATWTRPGQVGVPQQVGVEPIAPPRVSSTVTVPAPAPTTTVLKPTAVRNPAPAPGPTSSPTPPAVDPDLVAATLVQAPGNTEPAAHEVPAAPKPAGPNTDGEATAKALPPGARMVNCKRIVLNYELKDVGASGVGGVELWCTQDAHTWQRGEIIAQSNHSFTVEVKDEGLYGFSLLARNGSGAGLEPPKAGDQPQVWVSVDVTKPVVQITALELTHAGKAPGLTIRWTARDKNLAARPINLAYAEEPEGPWTPIAVSLDNSGQYEWQPAAALPRHVYVRLEAADLHGNVGATQTANPLRIEAAAPVVALSADAPAARKPLPAPPALDASRPTAAILGVEAAGN